MKKLISIATFTILTQNPALAGSNLEVVNAAWFIGKHGQSATHHVNKRLLSAAIPEPVAINSASAVVALDQALVFIDPVGPQGQYKRFGRPDIVVLTRNHPTHLSIDTMIGLLRRDTVVLAPQAVIDQLPLMISNNVLTPFEAGMTQEVDGIKFTAHPTSATIPLGAVAYIRDRGDIGVLIEVDGARVYF